MSLLEPTKWYLKLEGNSIELDDLVEIFASTELRFIKSGDKYYFSSSEMQTVSKWNEVLDIATEQLDLVKGIYLLVIGSQINVTVEKLIPPEGVILEPIPVKVNVDTLRTVVTKELLESIKYPQMRRAVEAAERFPRVSEALWFYAHNERNYISFYKIFEIIRDDVGCKEEIVSRGYLDSDSLNNLTENLNVPKLSGKLARHARCKQRKPDVKQLSFREIESLVKELINRWIEDKLNRESMKL